jgi:hypothetical protein|tara:strand:- start:172 stop:360 length:189 start_codon:yes stop_codon:yes gene_type:complete
MADDVLSLLRKKIREQMNEIADQLAVGTASTMEEYRKMCGMIEGLAWTEREILDLEEKLRQL